VITDITEQKKMQQQRREEREFLENIFQTTNDGIVVSDTSGKILRVNTTIEELLGYDAQEIIGTSALSFFPKDGELRRQGLDMAALLREEGSVQNWETEWCRMDGSRVPVEINVTFLRDREGNATGAVAAVRDITERRTIEQHLVQAEKLKSLGEMASGVAHDFNNMLTAILGRAQLIKRMFSDALQQVDADRAAEIEKGLAVIEDAALDGAETVRRIQDFSRTGTSQRFYESVDLAEVINGALEYTRARWKDEAELKGLSYCIENTLKEPVPVEGNAAELREVFTNLINNSLDAMPKGGTLSFSAECDTETITVTLQDTGSGISGSILDRIFDPFFTTKGPQSTGLGMSVSYGIITRHKGSISMSSEEGKGATLTIVLPLGRAECRVRSDSEPALQGVGLHVLVIDDEADVREVLMDMLTSLGHRVESAIDGPTGIEMFRATPFDLVFTDLGMPGISGWDVAREIKSIREQTLLALVTGWDVQYQKDNIEQHRVDFVLNKPFQVAHVMDVLSMASKRLNPPS
jgi:PAS domain S-box-containing protein